LVFVLVNAQNKSTAGRIDVLVENARRISAGQPPGAALSGNDELAKLDVVLRKMAEALKTALNKERAVIDLMPVAFFTLSADHKITMCNSRAEQMFDARTNELIGLEM